MKNYLVLFFLFITFQAFGQIEKNSKDRSRFGFRSGLNFNKYSEKEFKNIFDFKGKIGFDAGMHYRIRLSEKFEMPMELVYSRIGVNVKNKYYDIPEEKFRYNRMALQLLLSYNIVNGLLVELEWFSLGAYFAPKYIYEGEKEALKELHPLMDFAIGGGVGYEFKNRIGVYARVKYTYFNLYKLEDDPIVNVNEVNYYKLFQPSLTVGYLF